MEETFRAMPVEARSAGREHPRTPDLGIPDPPPPHDLEALSIPPRQTAPVALIALGATVGILPLAALPAVPAPGRGELRMVVASFALVGALLASLHYAVGRSRRYLGVAAGLAATGVSALLVLLRTGFPPGPSFSDWRRTGVKTLVWRSHGRPCWPRRSSSSRSGCYRVSRAALPVAAQPSHRPGTDRRGSHGPAAPRSPPRPSSRPWC